MTTTTTKQAGPRALWSWSLYDFANSAFTTIVITFIFSIYFADVLVCTCLLYTSPSPRDKRQSRMPSSA